MPKIDVYLRSLERFGASGAVLTSGQAVTLRFPQGDRHATQVTQHEQLVAIVREVASPAVLAQLDHNRPARFEVEANSVRYTLTVTPRPGSWQVIIETAGGGSAPKSIPSASASASAAHAAHSAPRQPARAATAPATTDAGDMAIERGQYSEAAARATSGSPLLDQWTAAARSARATDVYIATGAPLAARVGGEVQPLGDRGPLDAETISREIGVVAPADARAAWTERGLAVFTYGDGVGRVRATLTRDHRGPGASLRLLVGEPPALDRLGIAREVVAWLDERGLVLVGGPTGIGKTTTLAALVRALGEKRKRVVTFENPIEIIHVTNPWVSQRALGEHVPDIVLGVRSAMREGADAIVVGAISSPEVARAVIDAVNAGHLVLGTIATSRPHGAVDQLIDLLPYDRRDLARATLEHGLLGTIAPVVKAGGRSFEVVAGRGG